MLIVRVSSSPRPRPSVRFCFNGPPGGEAVADGLAVEPGQRRSGLPPRSLRPSQCVLTRSEAEGSARPRLSPEPLVQNALGCLDAVPLRFAAGEDALGRPERSGRKAGATLPRFDREAVSDRFASRRAVVLFHVSPKSTGATTRVQRPSLRISGWIIDRSPKFTWARAYNGNQGRWSEPMA